MTVATTYQIITPDGVTFNLDGTHYRVAGALDNVGMPPVRAYTHQVPGQPGAVLDDLLDDVRVVTISLAAHDCDIEKVFQAMNDHMANFRYNRTLTLQPLRLRVTVNGTAADLYCYYGGMITSEIDNVHALYGFTLVAYDPYWYSTSTTTTALDASDPLIANYILGKINGAWHAMGSAGTGTVLCIAIDAAGDLYVGGNFTDWGGIAAADYIVKYDVSAGTWSAVGATPLNERVTDIAIAASGDIYICGAFTNAGGAGTADYIAVLLSGAADWTTITASGAADAYIYKLLLTDDGYLWAGGIFDTIGGVASYAVARMTISTGTWSATPTMPAATDSVFALAQGQDGTIYAGGLFANAGGDGDADSIAQWNGTAWSAVGGPINDEVWSIVPLADGTIYAAGHFTTWDGVTVNRIGKWNGSAVEALDTGLDDEAYTIYVDDENNVWVGGKFTTAGGLAVYDGIAIWNGNAWRTVPVEFPSVTEVGAIRGDGTNIYFGFDTAGVARVPGDASVTYSGNVAYPPTISFTGAGTLYSIRNETTGVEVYANLVMNPGETITIDLGAPGEIPAGKSITSNWAGRPNAGNLLGKILSPTALSRFALAPAPVATSGANLINCFVSGYAVDYNDNNNQLSGWSYVTGLTAANTNAGRIYPNIVDDGAGFFHIEIYKVATDGAANLIAHTATYNTTGAKALVADNASGVGGTVTVSAIVGVEYDCYVDFVLASVTFYNRYDSLQAAVD